MSSSKKNATSFTQASLLAREEKVLQDAEIVITTQRTRIGELRSELERLNAEKIYWSSTHMKEMSDVIQENTKLRLQLDEMQADLNALRHTQDSTDNLITNLTEALGVAESQLLAQENELKSLRGLAGNLPIENSHLREENQRLTAENEKLKRQQGESNRKPGESRSSKGSDAAAIQAVNADLSKHAKLARDLDFRTEELRVNKMCLLQLESDLLEHQLLVEQQRVEIQRLNTAVEALNREKALVPPVVITSRQFDSFPQGEGENPLLNVSAKQFAEQVVSEIAKSLPKIRGNRSYVAAGADEEDYHSCDGAECFEFGCAGAARPDDMDVVQYRTMEEQRMLISRLLKGLDQLGFTRSDATCYKEKASDYRWFYSSVVSHSVTYSTRISGSDETRDNISPPGFFNLFVRVESGNIAIFQNMEEEVPLFSIKPWKCSLEVYEKSKQFVLTRTSTTSDQVENHILYCQTEDEFNRWYYALCYGGFIESGKVGSNNTRFVKDDYSNKIGNNLHLKNANIADDHGTSINAGTNINNSNTGSGNVVVSIKIMESENNSKSYETSKMSIYNNHLSFSNGRSAIDTTSSKLSINHKKSLIIVTEQSCDGSNDTIIITSEDLRDYEDLKKALIGDCIWMEVDKNVGSKLSTKTYDSPSKQGGGGASDKKLIPHSINFSMNNSVSSRNGKDFDGVSRVSSSRHGVILVKDGEVLLYHDESDRVPFTKISVKESSIECDRRKMSILLISVRNKQAESFYYMFSSLEEFNRSWSRLREGGIQEIQPECKPSFSQMCVVCKNKMHFYKGNDDSSPFLAISPDDTNCHIDSERNEIILLHSQGDGSRKRIILDCANMDEFTRWNIALQFGGFIAGVTKSCMSKYTFDISLFGIVRSNGIEQLKNIDTKESKPIYKDFYNIADYQSIEIFNSNESRLKNTPLFTIPFKDTEYYGDAKKRQIVFLTRRGKTGEVRIIINLQTLSNFDTMNKDLVNVDFPLLETNSATSLKAEYIVGAKEGLLCVYCIKNKDRLTNLKHMINDNRYMNKGSNNNNSSSGGNNRSHEGSGGGHHMDTPKSFPECGYIKYTTNDFICVVSRAGRSVVLRRKEDDYDALSVRCKSLTEYEKWERSMSIAGFINTEVVNNSFLPPITYLFHSLDYDFRKQPILPNLDSSKTVGGSNSPTVAIHSDVSLESQDEVTTLGGGNDENNMYGNKGVGLGIKNSKANRMPGNNLEVPNLSNSKLLDTAGIHKQSPPMTRIRLESSSSRKRRIVGFDLSGGCDADEWGHVSEICARGEDEGEESYEDDENGEDFFNKLLLDMDEEPEMVINIGSFFSEKENGVRLLHKEKGHYEEYEEAAEYEYDEEDGEEEEERKQLELDSLEYKVLYGSEDGWGGVQVVGKAEDSLQNENRVNNNSSTITKRGGGDIITDKEESRQRWSQEPPVMTMELMSLSSVSSVSAPSLCDSIIRDKGFEESPGSIIQVVGEGMRVVAAATHHQSRWRRGRDGLKSIFQRMRHRG